MPLNSNISGLGRCLVFTCLITEIRAKACTIESCEGVNLLAGIQRDLEPWRERGGITRKDVDEAQSWRVHRNQFTKQTNEGWIRITIFKGKLYVSHLGSGFGSRDAVWVLALMDIMTKHSLPDVDFVLSPTDKSQVEKARWPWRDMLPFMLSYSQSPDHVDVPVPDSSFWAWPEKAIRPQWELMNDAEYVWPWAKKVSLVHWRGGLARSGGLRKKLASCANESPRCTAAIDIRAAGPNTDLWEPPMGPCRFKYSVFAQGEGFTSSKHRNLACGSLPIFLEYNPHDTYYGRFLEPDVHYKRIRYSLRNNATDQDDGGSCICADLDRVAAWALSHDKEAKAIGDKARDFADRVLGRSMVEAYVVALLKETAMLQQRSSYDYTSVLKEVTSHLLSQFDVTYSQVHGAESFQSPNGIPLQSPQDLLKRFREVDDLMEHTEEWARRESAILTAIASMEGKPCPKTSCSKCCGNPALRANPNRIVRSPCGKTVSINSMECPSNGASGLDSSDPWHRDSLRSLESQKREPLSEQMPQPAQLSGHEPAWKQWLRTQGTETSRSSLLSTPRDPVIQKKYGRGNDVKPSGSWGNKIMTQKTNSDPLAGRQVVRTQHD